MDADKAAANLESLTDHVEERQLDAASMAQAVSALAAADDSKEEERRQRERELAAVDINDADVDLIVQEMELERAAADRKLREAGGDVTAALRALIQA